MRMAETRAVNRALGSLRPHSLLRVPDFLRPMGKALRVVGILPNSVLDFCLIGPAPIHIQGNSKIVQLRFQFTAEDVRQHHSTVNPTIKLS
jgi:hypothetical protein